MSFSSPVFLSIVLPLLLGGHFAMPPAWRKVYLLVASLIFYIWIEPVSVLVLVALAVATQLFAKFVARKRRIALIIAIGINLVVLALYKYNSFLADCFAFDIPRFALAAGMSFYVFQLISYLVDVYDGKEQPTSTGDLLLFTSFFPKIPCGPIVRFGEFKESLDTRRFTADNFSSGLRRFFIGLAKKVLLADMLAKIVNPVFGTEVHQIPSVYCWLAAIAYMLQIYFDFSGYSDMAIGIAKMLNFKFPENFDFPYSSKSIQEFWRRWHISLSFWFRDYVYIPMGGSRKGNWRACFNSMIVFILCGIWHGSTWTFALWGASHGLILLAERMGLKKVLGKAPAVVANVYVLIFSLFSWVLFRSPSVEYAFGFMRNMILGNPTCHFRDFAKALFFVDYSSALLLIAGVVLSYPFPCKKLGKLDNRLHGALFAFIAILAYIFAMTGAVNPGIYENF